MPQSQPVAGIAVPDKQELDVSSKLVASCIIANSRDFYAMTPRLPMLASLLIVLPLTALAQCPTAADMTQGVRVTFDNGDTTDLRRMDGTLIEVTERYSLSMQTWNFELEYGVYSQREIEVSPGGVPIPESEIRFSYPAALPAPDPAAPAWQGQREVREFGMGTEQESWQVGFRAMEPVVIGACTYEAVAVGIRLRAGEPDQKDQFSYFLPELGAGFVVTWIDEDGRSDTVPLQIEVMR